MLCGANTDAEAGDLERIREALSYIPADPRDTWYKMAMAVMSEVGESGREMWDAWSQTSDSYNAADARAVWKSVNAGGGIKIGTLFYEAQTNGWRETEPPIQPTPAEVAERKRISDEQAKKEAAKIERQQAETASKAAAIRDAATEARADNPYLARKGVTPTETLLEIDAAKAFEILSYRPSVRGEQLTGMLLVVPIHRDGQLTSLELINASGRRAARERWNWPPP